MTIDEPALVVMEHLRSSSEAKRTETFVLPFSAHSLETSHIRARCENRYRSILCFAKYAFGGATIPNAFLFFLHPAKTSQSHFLDLQALSGGINRILFLLSALLVREKLNLCLQEFSADEQQFDYLML